MNLTPSSTLCNGNGNRAIAVLILLATLPALPTLAAPFFGDDYIHIERLGEIRSGSLSNAFRTWVLRSDDSGAWWSPQGRTFGYFRPLMSLSLYLDHSFWGGIPFGYHLTNLGLHILTTLLLYGIARKTLGGALPPLVAAGLFAIHPCHTEAIWWIAARSDLLTGLLYVACFLTHVKSRPLRPASYPLVGLLLLLFALALLAKEMAITLPAVLLLYNLLEPGGEGLRRRLVVPGLAAGVGLLYLGLRTIQVGPMQIPPHPFAHGPGDPDMLQHLAAALILYLADLTLFVPPDPVVTFPFWIRHPLLLLALGALGGAVLVFSFRASRGRLRLFALGWIAISMSPVLLLSVGERFLYLPSVGYCLLMGSLVPCTWKDITSSQKRLLRVAAALVFCVALGKTLVYSALAGTSRQCIDDALVALDDNPAATNLLVVDLPAVSSLGFPHAIRLERPERQVQVDVLSMSPQFLWGPARARSDVSIPEKGLLHLLRKNPPYLTSYIERAYLGDGTPFQGGEILDRRGFTIRILQAGEGLLEAFEVRFRDPEPGRRVILQGDGFHLRPLETALRGQEDKSQ
jgi:hypothetical protein